MTELERTEAMLAEQWECIADCDRHMDEIERLLGEIERRLECEAGVEKDHGG